MKKEEQIKQLKTQLAKLQPLMELSKLLPKSHLSNFVSNELATEIKELRGMLEQLEKDSKETKKDFSDIVITSYVDCHGILQELETPTAVKAMYEEYPNVQFLGYNNNRYVFSAISEISTSESGPLAMLFFGKKKEKPLKHPHMKDIVTIGCLTSDMSIDFGRGEENIDWNEWDKVQIVGVDKQYGIVVKATEKKEDPNQFTLFFCEKK